MTGFWARPWKAAVGWLAFLAPFFFVTYRLANLAAGMRDHVPSVVFGWERHIPFVAWTILPYWSTDLLYGVSLFLCATRRELGIHARRLLTAQVISVAVFLLFPLRFSFERPEVSGWFGRLFSALYGFDLPYNQAPSLHLSLTVILWAAYSRHLRGPLLWVMRAWMVLVGISTLTTYQHHFIDLPSGIWVGLLAIALFPQEEARSSAQASRDPGRIWIGTFYAGAALVLGWGASRIGGAGWLLLWPAGALAVVAGIYWSGRAELFGKSRGRIARPVFWVIAPYLVGAWLNCRLRAAGWDEIAPGIRVGRLPRGPGAASVVDLTAELAVDVEGLRYRAVPMLDLLVPSVERLRAAVAAIEESPRPTLVCCAAGRSRSACAAAAWLLATGKARSADEAIERIRARRPGVVLGAGHRARLAEYMSGALDADALHDAGLRRGEGADFKIGKDLAIEAAGEVRG